MPSTFAAFICVIASLIVFCELVAVRPWQTWFVGLVPRSCKSIETMTLTPLAWAVLTKLVKVDEVHTFHPVPDLTMAPSPLLTERAKKVTVVSSPRFQVVY